MTDTIDTLREEFSFLDDWEDRYRHVIELGEALAPLTPQERVEANRVKGCVSQVWLVAGSTGDAGDTPQRILFRADSDAHIVRGLAAILVRLFSDRTAQDILAVDAEAVLSELGLDEHLSPQRSNGLRAMVDRIRKIAQASLET